MHAVTVVADAGLGKSRLLYEFSNCVELLPDTWYVFNGRAGEATQGLPYSLVRDLFSFRFEIQDSDPPNVAREKLERGMFALSRGAGGEEEARCARTSSASSSASTSRTSPHLSGILDDARQIRDRAFRYAAQFFADGRARLPLVLFLDDIHWADDGSLDFIDYLARHCARRAVLVLCLARPALLERRPAWGEGRERHTRLTFSRSRRRRAASSSKRFCGTRRRPAGPARAGRRRAEGNPFYVEELIKMLIDQRVIVTGAEVWSVDASRLGEVKVPPTLTGVLQARLDNADAGGEDRLATRVGHRPHLLGRRGRAPRRGRSAPRRDA